MRLLYFMIQPLPAPTATFLPSELFISYCPPIGAIHSFLRFSFFLSFRLSPRCPFFVKVGHPERIKKSAAFRFSFHFYAATLSKQKAPLPRSLSVTDGSDKGVLSFVSILHEYYDRKRRQGRAVRPEKNGRALPESVLRMGCQAVIPVGRSSFRRCGRCGTARRPESY